MTSRHVPDRRHHLVQRGAASGGDRANDHRRTRRCRRRGDGEESAEGQGGKHSAEGYASVAAATRASLATGLPSGALPERARSGEACVSLQASCSWPSGLGMAALRRTGSELGSRAPGEISKRSTSGAAGRWCAWPGSTCGMTARSLRVGSFRSERSAQPFGRARRTA